MMLAISLDEHAQRRERLMAAFGDDVAIILPTAPHARRNRDTEYRYRPDSDFYYLTGFAEPEALLVLLPKRAEGEFVLFCRPRDREMEIWNGYRAGLEGAVEQFRADQAWSIAEVDQHMPALLAGRKTLYVPLAHDAGFDQQLRQWMASVRIKARAGVQVPEQLVAVDRVLHEMRLLKSPAEMAVMQRAADISSQAHREAMALCKPGLYEFHLDAALMHHFMTHGCIAPAYNSIVGAGKNGCILHYNDNNAELKAGDLVLIDAGGEYQYYAADITRTFPVSGRFSAEQKALYEVVLAAQLAAIDCVRAGRSWQAPHETAVRVLCQGLLDLGLLQGSLEDVIANESYRRFYMHRTGHWLGMDVHDVGSYRVDGEWRPLQPGMVLTVEPGLYVAVDDDTVEPRWRGIGIRIEDDVCVTDDEPLVLTAATPKTVADIEALVGSA